MANQKSISKPAGALQKLRQIIREEVKNAIKEEMVPILLEVLGHKPNSKTSFPNKVTNSYSETLQTLPTNTSGVGSILEQTRREMLAQARMPDSEEYKTLINSTTNDLSLFTEEYSAEPAHQVNTMLSTAVKSSREENVEITNIPDFSAMIKKMNL